MNILQRLLGRSSNPVFQTLAKNSDPEGSRLGAGAWRGSISAIHELTPTPCTAASHTHCPLPQGPWHLSRSAISFSPRTTRGWLPVGPPQSEAPGTGADKTGHFKMASRYPFKILVASSLFSNPGLCVLSYRRFSQRPVHGVRRRQWHPTPVLLPGKSHGQRRLGGCSPWGHEELDMTERLHFHFSLSCIGEENGNPLQCSCLENRRDGGACWAAIYGVPQSRT